MQRARARLGRIPGDQPGHGRVDDERDEEQEHHERQRGRGAQAQAHLGLDALTETLAGRFAEQPRSFVLAGLPTPLHRFPLVVRGDRFVGHVSRRLLQEVWNVPLGRWRVDGEGRREGNAKKNHVFITCLNCYDEVNFCVQNERI